MGLLSWLKPKKACAVTCLGQACLARQEGTRLLAGVSDCREILKALDVPRAAAHPGQALEAAFFRLHPRYQGSVTACIVENRQLWFCHVGRGCVYLARDGEYSRLTQPQRILQREFKRQLALGSADPTQARCHGERKQPAEFLGKQGPLALDQLLRPFPLLPGDTLLLCSEDISQTDARARKLPGSAVIIQLPKEG